MQQQHARPRPGPRTRGGWNRQRGRETAAGASQFARPTATAHWDGGITSDVRCVMCARFCAVVNRMRRCARSVKVERTEDRIRIDVARATTRGDDASTDTGVGSEGFTYTLVDIPDRPGRAIPIVHTLPDPDISTSARKNTPQNAESRTQILCRIISSRRARLRVGSSHVPSSFSRSHRTGTYSPSQKLTATSWPEPPGSCSTIVRPSMLSPHWQANAPQSPSTGCVAVTSSRRVTRTVRTPAAPGS